MSKTKNVLAALGIAAALGTAFVPLTSYAADSKSASVTVTMTVADVINMSIDGTASTSGTTVQNSAEMNVNDINETMTDTIAITTNVLAGYTLSVKNTSTATGLIGPSGSDPIPAITAEDGKLVKGTAAWGVKGDAATAAAGGISASAYSAVPASNVAALTVATPGTKPNCTANCTFNDSYVVTYGVATAATQAAGNYTTTIQYTATTK